MKEMENNIVNAIKHRPDQDGPMSLSAHSFNDQRLREIIRE